MEDSDLLSYVKDCPFREGNCIGNKCMLWIGTYDEDAKEHRGHCSIVKTYDLLDERFTCILAIMTIMLLLFAYVILTSPLI